MLAEQMHRARVERRFRALIEHSDDIVIVVSAAGTASFSSPAASRLLGLSDDDLRTTPIVDLAVPEQRAAVQRTDRDRGHETGAARDPPRIDRRHHLLVRDRRRRRAQRSRDRRHRGDRPPDRRPQSGRAAAGGQRSPVPRPGPARIRRGRRRRPPRLRQLHQRIGDTGAGPRAARARRPRAVEHRAPRRSPRVDRVAVPPVDRSVRRRIAPSCAWRVAAASGARSTSR